MYWPSPRVNPSCWTVLPFARWALSISPTGGTRSPYRATILVVKKSHGPLQQVVALAVRSYLPAPRLFHIQWCGQSPAPRCIWWCSRSACWWCSGWWCAPLPGGCGSSLRRCRSWSSRFGRYRIWFRFEFHFAVILPSHTLSLWQSPCTNYTMAQKFLQEYIICCTRVLTNVLL